MPSLLTRFWRHFDWILHAIEYGLLAWCGLMYLRDIGFCERQAVVAYIIVLIFAGIVGGLNELWQAQMPNKTGILG